MKILIIGSGAREYALADKIYDDDRSVEIIFAPGNGASELRFKNFPVSANDICGLRKLAEDEKVDYTIVGSEEPLCMGVVDEFLKNGLKIFGPKKEGARFELSKSYSKEFMNKYNIPSARYIKTYNTDEAKEFALNLYKESPYKKVVIKYDGLAAGKGVLIASSEKEIENYIEEILANKKFGEDALLVEEFLQGFESSVHVLISNGKYKILPSARDHKKIFEGEQGLNTGGMGTYSPNIEAEIYNEEIEEVLIKPFLRGLKEENIDFKGVLFAGIMISGNDIKVLEFNTRFGDPETEVIVNRFKSKLIDALIMVSDGDLRGEEILFNDKKVIDVVVAAQGYPEKYKKGMKIEIAEDLDKDVKIYYAGVKNDGQVLSASGGRVLNVVASADSFELAHNKVYNALSKIKFENMYYRRDIGPVVKRIYVCKKEKFDSESNNISKEIKSFLNIDIDSIKVYNRYDIEGLNDDGINEISKTILAEMPVDELYIGEDALKLEKSFKNAFSVRYHKGQFDQREQGLKDTIKVKIAKEDFYARCEKIYDVRGLKKSSDIESIKRYIINPVDSEEGKVSGIPTTLKESGDFKIENKIYDGFIDMDGEELESFLNEEGLAMSIEDLSVLQKYFKEEKRDPFETEVFMIDTYWSDHCRHTTFNTGLTNISFESESKFIDLLRTTLNDYMKTKKQYSNNKPISLMDLATIVAKKLIKKNKLQDLEISEEINACSIKVKVNVNGRLEDYLLMFKNETHNHPTEIEPFGGAQTCLGGAIRDPLSGRSYVYQAMRVTGASDPREDVKDTLKGKLPQRKIVLDAASGYSSYGNQIGLATGLVDEIYHEGYKAKRMEVGAVIAAAPEENVKRMEPLCGDIVILLGGDTGRDGIGGATGSSKAQNTDSVKESSAEVQKGNATIERKIQRLFRNKKLSKMIKRCNDFGAGGVSVAIGELSDSLLIHLDKVPLKYKGLSPKEIAISESQERMAVVISSEDEHEFIELARKENLNAVRVAEVTDNKRLIMKYNDMVVCDLSRDFLNSTGAPRIQEVKFKTDDEFELFEKVEYDDFRDELKNRLSDINNASKKGLIERFDSSVGRGTILQPLGGKNQLSPIQAMVARIPSLKGLSTTASVMSYGFDPYLSERRPYFGAYYAVVESLSKNAAVGASPFKSKLSFQEYFEKLGADPYKWSKPLEALLGAYKICSDLNVAPIGGKDSMSGTFNDLNVPPTLISFAVTSSEIEDIISNDFKGNMNLGLVLTGFNEDWTIDIESFKKNSVELVSYINRKKIKSAMAINRATTLVEIMQMAFGSDIGFDIEIDEDLMFKPLYGSYIVEYVDELPFVKKIGKTRKDNKISINGISLDMDEYKEYFEKSLRGVFGEEIKHEYKANKRSQKEYREKSRKIADEVNVLIPVFPGTNSEYDSKVAFEKEGAKVTIFVFNNMSNQDIENSLDKFASLLRKSQILFIPGGFSLQDEPDGSGKFIANVLRNNKVKEAVEYLLEENDGLILGVCNGFQALIKSGLLPYGKVNLYQKEDDPTLTYNDINRHVARIVSTSPVTNSSPWLKYIDMQKEYKVAISHGEGRLIISEEKYKELLENSQIAFEYIDNPNGSYYSIESLLSPDGKILGKMAHSERYEEDCFRNIPDIDLQNIFKAGVEYFKK